MIERMGQAGAIIYFTDKTCYSPTMPPNPTDFEKLLRFFQDVWAHALTLQEMNESEDDPEHTYEVLKAKYDKLAAQQFDIFYRALNDPEAFSRAVKGFLDINPKMVRFSECHRP